MPVPRQELFLAALPVFFFPLLLPAGVLLAPLLLAFAWKEDFPRWSYPLWGFSVLVAAYLQSFHGTIFGHWVDGGWWAWLPILAALLTGAAWRRSLHPARTLLQSIWRDWTLLAFAIYGGLPLVLLASYDEVRARMPMNLIQLLIFLGGAVLYLRQTTSGRRFAALAGGFGLSWLSLVIHQCLYWDGLQEAWMPYAGTWRNTLQWSGRRGGMLLLALSAPVCLYLLQRSLAALRRA